VTHLQLLDLAAANVGVLRLRAPHGARRGPGPAPGRPQPLGRRARPGPPGLRVQSPHGGAERGRGAPALRRSLARDPCGRSGDRQRHQAPPARRRHPQAAREVHRFCPPGECRTRKPARHAPRFPAERAAGRRRVRGGPLEPRGRCGHNCPASAGRFPHRRGCASAAISPPTELESGARSCPTGR
jgi:hypothetical protein